MNSMSIKEKGTGEFVNGMQRGCSRRKRPRVNSSFQAYMFNIAQLNSQLTATLTGPMTIKYALEGNQGVICKTSK